MKVSSEEIPQADILDDVVKTTIAVSEGAKSFQDIAKSIGKVERQGRYYRKAAEIAGLIITPGTNHSLLTPLGQEFIRTGPTLSNVEKPLNVNHSWMLDYMELDRGINLVWDGNDELFGSDRAKSDLEFLRLQ